jgi:hypothetical protein
MKENACFNVKCLKTILYVLVLLFWVSKDGLFTVNKAHYLKMIILWLSFDYISCVHVAKIEIMWIKSVNSIFGFR